jgi:hypothetical protein
MEKFIALQAKKVPIPNEIPQETQAISTIPSKKAEAKAQSTHNEAQPKAEAPQNQLAIAAIPSKIEPKQTPRQVLYANS